MKEQLSYEQVKELQGLGVDTSVTMKTMWEEDKADDLVSLGDILDWMPNSIDEVFHLEITKNHDGSWCACYIRGSNVLRIVSFNEELIDALFEMYVALKKDGLV